MRILPDLGLRTELGLRNRLKPLVARTPVLNVTGDLSRISHPSCFLFLSLYRPSLPEAETQKMVLSSEEPVVSLRQCWGGLEALGLGPSPTSALFSCENLGELFSHSLLSFSICKMGLKTTWVNTWEVLRRVPDY